MKKPTNSMNTLVTCASVLGIAAVASADFTGLSTTVSNVYSVESGNYATVRVWAEFDDPADQLLSVYGDADNPLSITTTDPAGFYQVQIGEIDVDTARDANPAFYTLYPSAEADTWVTIGCVDANGTMADGSTMGDNLLQTIGMAFDSDNPESLGVTNGAWFIVPDDDQGDPIEGKVLIGQFTVTDRQAYQVSGTVNLLWKDVEGETIETSGTSFDVTVDTYVAECDFNEDGSCDLIWQGTSGSDRGRTKVYLYNGPEETDDYAAYEYIANSNVWNSTTSWYALTYGDFNQDGHIDIVFQGVSGEDNGVCKVFFYDGNGVYQGSQLLNESTTEDLRGVVDINQDGNLDLILQETVGENRGNLVAKLLDGPDANTPYNDLGTQVIREGYTSWLVRCVTDWNNDGFMDIVWQGTSGSDKGKVKVFYYNGPEATDDHDAYEYMSSSTIFPGTTSWAVRGTRDFDRDGYQDLIWQGQSGGDRGKVKIYFYDDDGYVRSQYLFNNYTSWRAQ